MTSGNSTTCAGHALVTLQKGGSATGRESLRRCHWTGNSFLGQFWKRGSCWVEWWDGGGFMTDPRPITSRGCQRMHQGTVPQSCGIPKEAQKRRERNYQVAATWVWSSGASFGSSDVAVEWWNDEHQQWSVMICNDMQWYVMSTPD